MQWHEFINANSNFAGFAVALLMIPGLLFLPERNNSANRTLALLLAVLGLKFFYDGLSLTGILGKWPHLIFMQMPLVFLYGPLILVYLQKVTGRDRPKTIIHLIPFLLVVLCYVPALALSMEELRGIIRAAGNTAEASRLNLLQQWLLLFTTQLRMPLLVLHLGFYLVLAHRFLHRHKRKAVQCYANLEKVSLTWVGNLLWGIVAVWLLVPLRLLLAGNLASADVLGTLIVLAQVVLVFLLGLFGLWQKTISLDMQGLVQAADNSSDQTDAGQGEKYASSRCSAAQLEQLRHQLLAVMETEKPYLDSELSLPKLADTMAVPARLLSQLINGTMETNFLDFINRYRIDEARRLFEMDGNGRKVLDIAMSSGFNSKSAFYTAFKRHVGMTPTQYRSRQQSAVNSLI